MYVATARSTPRSWGTRQSREKGEMPDSTTTVSAVPVVAIAVTYYRSRCRSEGGVLHPGRVGYVYVYVYFLLYCLYVCMYVRIYDLFMYYVW